MKHALLATPFAIAFGAALFVSGAEPYRHGHLATTRPDSYGNVLLAVHLDEIPATPKLVAYTMDGSLGRAEWTTSLKEGGWMLLPIPANCREGKAFGAIEHIRVFAPNVNCVFCEPTIYDGVPPEVVDCSRPKRRAV